MEKRQDTDRPQTDRMTELAHAVVSTPPLASVPAEDEVSADSGETETGNGEADKSRIEDSEELVVAVAPVEAANDEVEDAAIDEVDEDKGASEETLADETQAEASQEALSCAEETTSAQEGNSENSETPAESAMATAKPLASSETEAESVSYEELGPQERLGRSLRDKRDDKGMSLDEIARTTKIPKTSLQHIEAGRFDSLPGDVFARGFLRSYARCVDMDGDEVVRRYAQCGLNPAPVSSALADAVLGGRRKQSPRRARGTTQVRAKTITPEDAPSRAQTVDNSALEAVSASEDTENGSADGNAVRKVLRDAFDLGVQVRSNIARHVPKTASSQPKNKSAEAVDNAECKTTRAKRTRTFVPPSFDYENDMTHRGPLTLGVIILVIVATLTMSYLLRHPGTNTDGFTMNEPSQTDALSNSALAGSAFSNNGPSDDVGELV